MPTYYLHSPALDPRTGDWLAGTSRPGGQPATQIVLWELRTQLSTYRPDPTRGVDYRKVQRKTASSQAVWKAEVERGLGRYVRAGVIRDLKVVVDPPTKDRLLYDVSFVDPRTAAREALRRLVA